MQLITVGTTCIIAMLALTACVTAGPQPSYPEITFTHLQPIKLNVAAITYEPRYRQPIAAPNIGHEFPTPPAQAVERWIADRLTAVGTVGQANILVHRATATETKLQVKKGLSGAFSVDQAWRYDVHVEVSIKATDPNRKITAQARVIAKQSRTMPEDASLSEREDIWFALTEMVMRKFNTAFEDQIRKDLTKFIK